MTLQENVEAAVKHGQSVIRKNKHYVEEQLGYGLNEATTCYTIIDPILRALGWKLDDPDQCWLEEWQGREGQEASGRTDYTFYKGVRLVALIEAKAISRTLNGFREENQLKNYRFDDDPKIWVLTNGRHWYFYRCRKHFGTDEYSAVFLDSGASAQEIAKQLIQHLSSRKRW